MAKAKVQEISGGRVRDDGFYEAPVYWYQPDVDLFKTFRTLSGLSGPEIQSAFQEWMGINSSAYADAMSGDPNAASSASTYKWNPQTMDDWLRGQTNGGKATTAEAVQQHIIDPATQLLESWKAQYAPTLQAAVQQGRGGFLTSAGDVGSRSKLVDANLESQYQNKYTDWMGAATQASADPFVKGTQLGYQGYLSSENDRLRAAAAAQQAMWTTLMSMQQPDGQMYTSTLKERPYSPPNVSYLPSILGSGGGSFTPKKSTTPKQDETSRDPNKSASGDGVTGANPNPNPLNYY